MAYQVLARKYRPQNFSDVIGQDHVTRTLKNALAQQRIAHGYIFSGHRGIGKTTIARILAMALNCQAGDGPQSEPCGKCDSCVEIRAGSSVDVIEIDAATNRGIDEIRELRDAARYRPARDRFKIYILDEAHQITDAAFNALLKTLEEPPSHIVFMMATTQPEDIPQTIRSRCQHFNFHAVKFDDIVGQLKSICAQEQIDADDEAIAMVAEAGDGSMRDALSIMDQAIASGSFADGRVRLTTEQIRGLVGGVSSEILERFMELVSEGNSADVLRLIDRLLTEGQSPTHFARQFVRYMRNALVAKIAGGDSEVLQISSDERARVSRTATLFSEEDLTRYLNTMLRTFDELGYKQEQRFHLELGLMKLVHAQRLLPLEQFLSAQPLPKQSVPPTSTPTRPATSPAAPATAKPSPFAADNARRNEPAASSSNPFASRSSAASTPSPSPFDSDRARKTTTKPEMSSAPPANPFTAGSGPSPFAVAPAVSQFSSTLAIVEGSAAAVALAEEVAVVAPKVESPPSIDATELRTTVLRALAASNQESLAETLGEGEWSVAENELRVQVALSPAVVNVLITPEIKRIASQALAAYGSRGLKLNVVPGLAAPIARIEASAAPTGSARSRAAEDPLVQYVQKKFGAEIRTVIDQTKQ